MASQNVLHNKWLGSHASTLNRGNPNWCREGYYGAICGA